MSKHSRLRSFALAAITSCLSTFNIHDPYNIAHASLVTQANSSVFLDNNCQRKSEKSNSWGLWRVTSKTEFKAGGQQHWLVVANYQDGSSLLCITQPGYTKGFPLAAPELQSQFIERVHSEARARSIFLIDVRSGNGRIAQITRYQLDLENPSKPRLSVIGQWKS